MDPSAHVFKVSIHISLTITRRTFDSKTMGTSTTWSTTMSSHCIHCTLAGRVIDTVLASSVGIEAAYTAYKEDKYLLFSGTRHTGHILYQRSAE